MSNAMSRSKSRWKGALLATVATAVISPMVAEAQSMSVGIYANPNPFGGSTNSGNVYTGNSSVFIDPYDTDTLYVYATVTGTSAPSATYVDGLEYLYFNVNAAATGTAGVTGSITAATPSALFGGGNFNQTTTNPGAGAQGGLISAITTTPSIVVGSNSSLGSIAKPRSPGNIFNTGTSSGINEIVCGNSVSFLVETLTYTPNSAAVIATPSAQGAVNSVAFNVSIPSVATIGGVAYQGSNYFVGLPSNPGLVSPGYANTSTGYTASATSIKLTNALPGDVNLDGSVNIADFNIINNNFNTATTGYTNGDLNNDKAVNIADFNILNNNFNTTLGSGPTGIASADSLIVPGSALAAAVPEPTSGLLLAGGAAASLLRRRRTAKI